MLHTYVLMKKEQHNDFKEYIKKHGYHFTDDLADYASNLMEPYSSAIPKIKSSEVPNYINEDTRLKAKFHSSNGDLAYLINMYNTDFTSTGLFSSIKDFVRMAISIINDEDGYAGMIFDRWLTDIKAKEIEIDWKKYV